MLAMISSNTRPDGTRGFQIKGFRTLWSAMKVQESEFEYEVSAVGLIFRRLKLH